MDLYQTNAIGPSNSVSKSEVNLTYYNMFTGKGVWGVDLGSPTSA